MINNCPIHGKLRLRAIMALGGIITIIFVRCATTNISSVVDPSSAKGGYSNILVISTFPDLIYKQTIENAFKLACHQKNISARTGSEILPPIREYAKEEITEKLAEANIDGLLIVALQGYWESQGYVPGYTTTRGTASLVGNTIIYSQQQQSSAGYIYSKPRVNFETRFFDGKNGNALWRSTSLTKGNAFADFSTLANSLAGATVGKLIADGIVAPYSAVSSAEVTHEALALLSPADALKLAETLYLGGRYRDVIVTLSTLKAHIDQSGEKQYDTVFLSKVYFLWGSCYKKAWNRIDLARQHYRAVLQYKLDFKPDKTIFDAGVIEEFEKYRQEAHKSDFSKQPRANEEEIVAQDAQEAAAIPGQSAPVFSAGDRIRIVKGGASLRVGPDQTSQVIRNLPLGALLEVEGQFQDWIKIKLPPGTDGITIVGFVHVSFIEPDK